MNTPPTIGRDPCPGCNGADCKNHTTTCDEARLYQHGGSALALARAEHEAAVARVDYLETVFKCGGRDEETVAGIEAAARRREAAAENLERVLKAEAETILRNRLIEAIDSYKHADNPIWRKDAETRIRSARAEYEDQTGRPSPCVFCVSCFSLGPSSCGRDLDTCDRQCRDVARHGASGGA